jgi:hypothetical protein
MNTVELTIESCKHHGHLGFLLEDLKLIHLLANKFASTSGKKEIPLYDLKELTYKSFSEFIVLSNPQTGEWQMIPYNPTKNEQDVQFVVWSSAATICIDRKLGHIRCYRQEGETLLDWCRRAKRAEVNYACRIVGCFDLNRGTSDRPFLCILDQIGDLEMRAAARLANMRRRRKI